VIFDFMLTPSDGESAMSEFWDLEDTVFAIRVIPFVSLLMVLVVTVGGCAVSVCRAHIHVTGVFIM
jgi:hypothetical protein